MHLFKHIVLNVKVLVGAFNQEEVLVGVFSMIVKTSRTFVSSSSQGNIDDGIGVVVSCVLAHPLIPL